MRPTPRLGRDGRLLVGTEEAAYSLGKTAKAFRDWSRRRGLAPAGFRPNPSRGQPLALWDLADIGDAARAAEAATAKGGAARGAAPSSRSAGTPHA